MKSPGICTDYLPSVWSLDLTLFLVWFLDDMINRCIRNVQIGFASHCSRNCLVLSFEIRRRILVGSIASVNKPKIRLISGLNQLLWGKVHSCIQVQLLETEFCFWKKRQTQRDADKVKSLVRCFTLDDVCRKY